MAKNIFALGVVLILSIISVLPLLHPGLHPTHDGEYHVIRFYEFDKVLRDGSIYPRWAPDLDNGHGVPLFNYVYPLPNYVASLFHAFGVSFIDSFKLQMFLASIIGSVFFYLWTRRCWGEIGGVVSSVFYTYSPYRFVDIYVRGSVGEVWAISLLPALLYTTDVYFEKRRSFYLVASAVIFSLIIFSHNILGLLFFMFYLTYVAYLAYNKKSWKKNILPSLAIIIFALSLSSIFWLPALLETRYVTGLQIYNVAENFPDLYQLIIPSWGTGFFNGNDLGNQMSVQIGIANMIGVLLGIFFFLKLLKNKEKQVNTLLFYLAWFFLACFLMVHISWPIWESVPFITYFQFPWRLLSIIVIVTPFLAGSAFLDNQRKIFAVLLIVISVFITIGYTKPAYYHDRDDTYYITRDNFVHGTNSPGNLFNTIWMKKELPITKKKVNILYGKAHVAILGEKSTRLTFSINASENVQVSVVGAYFPGWNAYVDSEKTPIEPDNSGLISFSIQKGNHNVEVLFEDTIVRKVSAIISIISFIAILAFLFGNRYRKTSI